MNTLALFLRVWLWMSVPMSVVILLWATWANYRIIPRHQGGVKLAIEGWEGQALPIGEVLPAASGEIMREERVSRGEEDEEVSVSHGGEHEVSRGREDERVSREEEERGGMGSGSEPIYQGILWMKEKYEQYREQADRRYELLREELRRSEQRYQELVMSMQLNQDTSLETVREMRSEEGKLAPGDLRSQLSAKQVLVDELETQLRIERLKTEELVVKLQGTSQLLLQVYQEMNVAGNGLRIWEE